MAAFTKIILIALCFLAVLALSEAQYGFQGSLSPSGASSSGSLGGSGYQGNYQGSQGSYQQQGYQGSFQGSRPQGSGGFQGNYGK